MTISPPAVTAEQMREVDRLMVEEFHIELVQMMGNAGRAVADVAVADFDPGRVLVLAGPGGNGGGGLVAARHLLNRGREVHVVTAAGQITPVTAHQLDTLRRIGIPLHETATTADFAAADLIVDALLGYSLIGDPREPAATLIRAANAADAPVLSLDAPSGLDVTTGQAGDPCIMAAATVTLALPKVGLLQPSAAGHVGTLYLADIGVPHPLYQRIGLDVGPIFASASIHRPDCDQ